MIEMRKTFGLETNETEKENISSSAEDFFDFIDDEQQEFLDGETVFYCPGLVEAYASHIIQLAGERPILVKPKQYELAFILKHTGDFPESFWTDVSKETAIKLGFFPRISKHGFLTAQIVRKPFYDEVNTYFHYCLSSYNQKRAIQYFNVNGVIEPK